MSRELQQYIPPHWWNYRLLGVEDKVEKPDSHYHATVRRANREIRFPICACDGHVTHRSLSAPLKIIYINRLSDGDPPARLARDQILIDTAADRPTAGCMGSGGA